MSDTVWGTREPGDQTMISDEDPTMLVFGDPDRVRLPNDPPLGEDAGREFRIIDRDLAPCVCGVQHDAKRHKLEGGLYIVYECTLSGWLVCKLKEPPK